MPIWRQRCAFIAKCRSVSTYTFHLLSGLAAAWLCGARATVAKSTTGNWRRQCCPCCACAILGQRIMVVGLDLMCLRARRPLHLTRPWPSAAAKWLASWVIPLALETVAHQTSLLNGVINDITIYELHFNFMLMNSSLAFSVACVSVESVARLFLGRSELLKN